MSDQPCQFDFTNSTQTVIVCKAHGEREVLRPSTRAAILSDLAKAGKWAGPALSFLEPSALPITAPSLASEDLVEYRTPDGQTVALSVLLFQQMLCPNANAAQARYMLGWCQHNRIDPFGNEAYFSIIEGKPVIQVSKDCWLRRLERNPAFVSHDSGIIVETDLPSIRDAVIAGFCPYLISEELKQRILADFLTGAGNVEALPAKLVIRKRGQFLGEKDTLLGGWAEIQRHDRPAPYLFQIDVKGWETTKQNGDLNHFWQHKAPFMIWKSALKNCARLAFPELSGLIAQPERDLDPAAIADAEFTAPNSTEQKRKLFALGRDIPPPLGPLAYEQLHALAEAFFEGKGISELTMFEMARFLDKIELAVGGDPLSLGEIRSHLLSTGDVSTPDLTLTKHRER